jgi:hypothetical protein
VGAAALIPARHRRPRARGARRLLAPVPRRYPERERAAASSVRIPRPADTRRARGPLVLPAAGPSALDHHGPRARQRHHEPAGRTRPRMGSADTGRTGKPQYPGWMVVRFHRPIRVSMTQETTPSPSYVPMPGTGRGACGPLPRRSVNKKAQRRGGMPLPLARHEASGDLHHSRAAMYFFRPSMS